MPEYKKQHYLPEFYLNNFAFDLKVNSLTSRNIYFVTAENRTVRHKGIGKLCTQSFYYSIKDSEGHYNHALEQFFNKLESAAKPIIEKFLNLPNLTNSSARLLLSESDKIALCGFIIWLHFRSPYILENLKNSLSADFVKIRQKHNRPYANSTEQNEELKQHALDIIAMINENNEVLELLFRKKWHFVMAPAGSEFVISDNPVTFLYKGGKLDDARAEIHIPLSPDILLVLMGRDEKLEGTFIPNINSIFVDEYNHWVAKQAHSILLGRDKKSLEKLISEPKFPLFVIVFTLSDTSFQKRSVYDDRTENYQEQGWFAEIS